jgi:hypothetical protein
MNGFHNEIVERALEFVYHPWYTLDPDQIILPSVEIPVIIVVGTSLYPIQTLCLVH